EGDAAEGEAGDHAQHGADEEKHAATAGHGVLRAAYLGRRTLLSRPGAPDPAAGRRRIARYASVRALPLPVPNRSFGPNCLIEEASLTPSAPACASTTSEGAVAAGSAPRSPRRETGAEGVGERREQLDRVRRRAEGRHLEDGRLGVLVDRHDRPGSR